AVTYESHVRPLSGLQRRRAGPARGDDLIRPTAAIAEVVAYLAAGEQVDHQVGVRERAKREDPPLVLAVVDCETSGLQPGAERPGTLAEALPGGDLHLHDMV